MPREYGGQELPPVYDVIVDEELARAGAPPRPSVGYLVFGIGRHGSEALRQRFLPASSTAASAGVRASASRVPARIWRR
ncbi:acyl-CoA dehydrogenase, N-terminal domain protein [Mycobacterium kansasii 662]|uniref:Acyl-CoA dehydrogenase, N-terminal domain protein n=1 Tax=Mycobacterium kansasii 662 TaxID=1299326 RepID=X7YGQ7_MYCKA|nr:acyl-CoA dehydrogenase, N-terminal domain protein [Mycobacterium kansasii 662]